jgi:uncharacterized protein YprB with RNaseH-like and TPR domain
MGFLFFDIETYVAPGNPASGLNPYFPESKVLVISHSHYETFHPPTVKTIRPPRFLKEWESSEHDILFSFLELLRVAETQDPYLFLVGFNILNFDLPYLFGRMKAHRLAAENELYDLLFSPRAIDLYQLTMTLPDKLLALDKLCGTNQKEACRFFGIKEKEGVGTDCSRYYDAGAYDEIMRYCTQEFTFEQMLDGFHRYIRRLVTADRPPGE